MKKIVLKQGEGPMAARAPQDEQTHGGSQYAHNSLNIAHAIAHADMAQLA